MLRFATDLRFDHRATACLMLHFMNDLCHPEGRVIRNAEEAALRTAAVHGAEKLLTLVRNAGIPVFYARMAFPPDYRGLGDNAPVFRRVKSVRAGLEGQWGSQIIDELAPLPHELVITHIRTNPFYCTPLEPYLRDAEITSLILAGVSTHGVIQIATRFAVDVGFEVTIAADACATYKRELHEYTLLGLREYATISSVDDIVGGLSTKEFLRAD